MEAQIEAGETRVHGHGQTHHNLHLSARRCEHACVDQRERGFVSLHGDGHFLLHAVRESRLTWASVRDAVFSANARVST